MKYFRDPATLPMDDFESDTYLEKLARDYAAHQMKQKYYDSVSAQLSAR